MDPHLLPTASNDRVPVGDSTETSFGDRAATIAPPTVPGYQIDGLLGEGGMGAVYRARQIRADRIVALKTIRGRRVIDPEARRRFEAEARAVAALDHPNVVRVFDVGEAAGLPYYALEFCPNGSLQSRFRGTPWEPREAAATLEKIARGVAAAHRKGIVHRDLKPANVLLAADGEPKVGDFGLAKRLDLDEGLTQDGSLMGTPDYMAPEQTYHLERPVSTATDVFSLGVILFQSLTGVLPFWASSRSEKLHRTAHAEPVAPRSINPHLPRDLETICLKCLEKEPSRRYPDASVVADELRRFLDGKATLARPAGRFEKCLRWMKRNPLPTAFAGFFVAAFVAVTILAVVAVRASSEANAHAKRADAEKHFNKLLTAGSYFQLQNYPAMRAALDAIPPEARHWEWGYLRRVNPLVQEWHDHREEITCLATDPERKRLVTGSRDKTVKVWDAVEGKPIASIKPRERAIWSVAIHPTLPLVALGGEGGHFFLWDYVEDRILLNRLKANPKADTDTVSSVAFSGDGSLVASAGWNKTIEVRDLRQPETVLHTLKGHSGTIDGLAFVGNTLISGSWDGAAWLWDATTGEALGVLAEGLNKVLTLAPSPTGEEILLSAGDGSISLWSFPERRKLREYRKSGAPAHALAWSLDGKRFARGNRDGTAVLYDRDAPEPRDVLRLHAGETRGVAFHPTEPRLFSVGLDHRLKSTSLMARPSDTPFAGVNSHSRRVTSLVPFGDHLASVSMDATLKVWDRRSGELLYSRPHALGVEKYLWAVAISPDGKEIATGGDGGAVRLWDAATGEQTGKLGPARDKTVAGLAYRPGTETLVAAEHGGVVRLWDRRTGDSRELRKVEANIETVEVSPSGRYLACGSWNHTVGLYDLNDLDRFLALDAQREGITSVAFSPDERLLASASTDGTIQLWEIPSGKPLTRIEPGGGQVYCVAWSPDSRRIVYGMQNGELRLWNVERRDESLTLSATGEPIKCVCWSEDGESIYSGDWKGTIRVWKGSPRAEWGE